MEWIGCYSKQMLLNEIVNKRNKMIMIALNTGLSSIETIKCSQELDSLLNQYEQMKLVQGTQKRSLQKKLISFIGYSLNNSIKIMTR